MDEFKKYLKENQEQLNTDEPSPLIWDKVQQRVKAQSEHGFPKIIDESQSENLDSTTKVFSVRKLMQWSAAACVLGLAGIGVWYLLNDESAVKPLQEQVVINEEKLNSTPLNSRSNSFNNSTSNRNLDQVVVATESSAPASNTTQPILNKPTPSIQRRTASINTSNNNNNAMTAFSNMESGFTQIINLQKGKISTTPMYAESASYFNEFKAQIIQLEQEEKQIKKEIAKKGLTDHQLDQLINLYQYKLTVLKQLQLEMNKTNNRYKQNRGPVDSTRAYFINI